MTEGNETAVYRAFASALVNEIEDRGDEISDLAQALRTVNGLQEVGCHMPDARPQLATMKERFSLTWDAKDPLQAAASEAFPDKKSFDAERYLRLACTRFGIDYEEKEEVYASLLQAILDEQAEAQEAREARERLEADKADAEDRARKADERAKELEALLERANAEVREYASSTLKVQLSGDEGVESVIAKMRAEQTTMPATSGYCDAILRSIARKCDVEDASTLAREELVQRITDTLDARLIPKGMRIRKVGSR